MEFYGLLVSLLSMLLVLTLVYFLHGFQTHAAPLASLLAESSNITTVLSTSPQTCICPADQRSIWDIVWSCLATIFACSWVSVHPNIPAPHEAQWRIFLRRLELVFWAVIGPEMIITWALRQWLSARRLEKVYKGELPSLIHSIYPQILNHNMTVDRGWTKTHGHFIQMGGFMLFEGNDAKGVLYPERFSELLRAGKIEFPTVSVEEIEDRSKADGFSKTIALSLATLNRVMYFLWWHKSLDVRCPVPVYLLDNSSEPNEHNKRIVSVFDYLSSIYCEFY